MVYKWKSAARLRGLDPQACGQRLAKIEKQAGLTPENVVEDARAASSPLHDGFTWDDSEAAEKFRLDEARYILRAIIIVTSDPIDEDEEPSTVRAFFPVKEEDEEESSYVNVTDVMSDSKLRAKILTRAYDELTAWKERYNNLEEFADVRKAIVAARSVVKKKRKRK
jgi:hypothetical protein